MITTEELQKWSKPHAGNEGKRTVLENDNYILSIVGGRQGLYGDFKKDFEIAIIDKSTNDFVTKMFVLSSDDVLPYQSIEEVSSIADIIFSKTGFRVQ